ncbi:hypothetical protein [Nesterenkonia sp. HG001]|uniref:hypothetical protein n=1 Tax=Nesterenkonia sp. HG001 TaxID=2983207 RepID=UPI002AC46036|nr:hypothetical protein [Nesterenkonia sp. HG001]MDZ5076598.1 hypothetical protein [Nesterenkonia sp. HG001]
MSERHVGQGEHLESLVEDYIALCNRAMNENWHSFSYRQAKRLNRLLWGGSNFRTVVYGDDPSEVVEAFTIHFDPDEQALSLLPPGDHDIAFAWKVSVAYLRDVVQERPEWYVAHPMMLDWIWMKDYASDEIGRIDGRSFVAGAALGAAAAFASVAVSRARGRGA